MKAKKKRRLSWTSRIAYAEKRGRFTRNDYGAALGWVTCACGEQDPRIPRKESTGAPVDVPLLALGCEFAGAVGMDQIARAQKLLHKIERRASIIVGKIEWAS